MKLIKPMRWKEGMFLRPQHFQQYDLYLENREFSRFQSLQSCGWGLLQLEIDEEALGNFVFNVKRLTAVLPEGALVDVPGNARIGGRPFDAVMKEVGRPMDVSVAYAATARLSRQHIAQERIVGVDLLAPPPTAPGHIAAAPTFSNIGSGSMQATVLPPADDGVSGR